jgi:hypothetical protein
MGIAVVWSVISTTVALRGDTTRRHTIFIVAGGFAIGWLSATIARWVYPPPRKWLRSSKTDVPDDPK